VEQEFDDTYLFAAQVLAGVSYELSSSWSIYAETRYNYAGSIQLEPTAGGASVEADYNGFSFLAGLRYQF
jgi:opacity protein-like surface antigen